MSFWVKRLYIQNQIELHKMVFNLIISPRSSCIFMYENNETVAIFWSATEKYPSEGELFSHVNENSSDRFTFRIRTKNRRSHLTALTLVWFSWDLKYPHYCSKSVRDVDPGDVVNLHSSHHSRHGLGGYSKLINGLRAAASGAFVCWRPSLLFTC